MEIIEAYALAVAAIVSCFVLVTLSALVARYGRSIGLALFSHFILPLLAVIAQYGRSLALTMSRYFVYPWVIERHALIGPWNAACIILHLFFLAVNVFCLTFRVASVSHAGRRGGTLALTSLSPLLLGFHLGFVADLLGVSLHVFRRVHRSVAIMAFSLATFHVATAAASEAVIFSKSSRQPFTILVSNTLCFQRHIAI